MWIIISDIQQNLFQNSYKYQIKESLITITLSKSKLKILSYPRSKQDFDIVVASPGLNILLLLVGNYSVYGFEIKLTRSIGPFILSVYLPSAMFVTMSWVSFFIPPVITIFSLFFQFIKWTLGMVFSLFSSCISF